MSIDSDGLRQWFEQYLDTFAACARGEREIAELLRFYGVPMLVTSEDGAITVTTDDEAAAVMQGQMDGLRSARYHHSDVLTADVTVLNSSSALYTATLSRRDVDDDEIDRGTMTYVVTEISARLEIAVLAIHA